MISRIKINPPFPVIRSNNDDPVRQNQCSSVLKYAATEFVFNGFKQSDVSVFGNATNESRILTLSNDSTFSIGIDGTTSAQNLSFLNFTNNGNPNNHVFGVEFDVFKNQEFNDINDNHVGIDVNSLTSVFAHEAGYWPDENSKYSNDGSLNEESFETLKLNNGRNYQVWIDYADFRINVTIAPVGMKRPEQPLLDFPLNLSQVFEEEIDALITHGLPSFELPKDPVYRSKGFIAGMTVSLLFLVVVSVVVSLFLIKRSRIIIREREDMEDWELEYWPHRITYQEIDAATKGFADENVIGIGGNGRVYKGVLAGGSEVAVKLISHESSEGARQFLAEISSLGRLKQRNLVSLRGWCKKERGSLILVYDYMEHVSLDKRLFECDERNILSFEDRVRILKDVASGVQYLHEGWEAKVLHRDIKASNVLLDMDMSARLVLEVMCGRRPIEEEGKPPLVDWLWELMRRGELINAFDSRLKTNNQDFNEEEALRVLQLGMICANLDPKARPTMRQVVKFFDRNGDVDEYEAEDMDVYLLETLRSNTNLRFVIFYVYFLDKFSGGW
ncbi:hypothetical protein RND71_033496 [Anisodus tanguticus]|uniref:Protein kinase domain-containing protein n=1 Tax=Anisodus tanguticus TaxID=243964 RepID=A0AAE1RAB5_9SOLA|nr:hypothetical protein RND71_033496 [Anisodus tanguticus]